MARTWTQQKPRSRRWIIYRSLRRERDRKRPSNCLFSSEGRRLKKMGHATWVRGPCQPAADYRAQPRGTAPARLTETVRPRCAGPRIRLWGRPSEFSRRRSRAAPRRWGGCPMRPAVWHLSRAALRAAMPVAPARNDSKLCPNNLLQLFLPCATVRFPVQRRKAKFCDGRAVGELLRVILSVPAGFAFTGRLHLFFCALATEPLDGLRSRASAEPSQVFTGCRSRVRVLHSRAVRE